MKIFLHHDEVKKVLKEGLRQLVLGYRSAEDYEVTSVIAHDGVGGGLDVVLTERRETDEGN